VEETVAVAEEEIEEAPVAALAVDLGIEADLGIEVVEVVAEVSVHVTSCATITC